MYTLHINQLTQEQFLKEYWQKKPLLIKGGFKDFVDPISPDELAGLAMEEGIESRIVTNNDNWQCAHGPFEDFSLLTEQHSTLLVQAVDHWHPESAQLLNPFRFIPNWRIDDLMVSFSTVGGGVGPHVDQYDVFIIQGQGKRHWRVGAVNKHIEQYSASNGLLQVHGFDAVIDEHLERGDILYIPPNAPHEGYAIENALNYSVGFRAPEQVGLLSQLADFAIDHELGKKRYSDPELTPRTSRGQLSDDEVARLRALLKDAIDDDSLFIPYITEALSQPKHDKDLAPLEPALEVDELFQFLESSPMLFKAGGLRALYYVSEAQNAVLLAVEGQHFDLDLSHLSSIKNLCDHECTSIEAIKNSLDCSQFAQTLTTLLNEGYWYCD